MDKTFAERVQREQEERDERTRAAEERERLKRQHEFTWGKF